jgi:hypothetical protein
VSRLSSILREQYGHLGITGLREIGQGLDARVYHGSSATLGDVTVRVPHARYLNSGNETQLDTRRQLRQDFELSGHLRVHGLPVPAATSSVTAHPTQKRHAITSTGCGASAICLVNV